MKHCFQPVPSTRNKGRFFVKCSISHHLVMLPKTKINLEFPAIEDVEKFSLHTTGVKLASGLFKECANALLLRHGATLVAEEPNLTGIQKEFRFQTICGPATVIPLDDWVIFRFLEPQGKHFPWAMSGNLGKWNLHCSRLNLSELLEDLDDRLVLSKAQPTEVVE